jgi:hypothetical protein
MRRRSFLAAPPLVAVAACVTVEATPLRPGPRPSPVPVYSVRIYRTFAAIACPYEEIALLHASGPEAYTTPNTLLSAAKRKAAQIGGNGVVLEALSEPSEGAKVAAAVFGVPIERRGQMVAVRVRSCPAAGDSVPARF